MSPQSLLGRAALLAAGLLSACRSPRLSSQDYHGPPALLSNGIAHAPPQAPAIVHRVMAAGNELQGAPYQYGGGHGRPSYGVDCSGMVSYALRSAGLLRGATTSQGFQDYGSSGPGQWITVYAKDGHTFMTIAGLRLDTGGNNGGPRWTTQPRRVERFDARHPSGL